MTTYTALSDASLSQDKPLTQSIARAFRDNPVAMAEGDGTAPEVVGVKPYLKVTASNSSALVFTDLPDNYDVLEWDFVKLFPATAINQMFMEFSVDNGSTWLNTGYVGYYDRMVGASPSNGTLSTSRADVTGNPSFNNATPQTINGKMLTYNLCTATQTKTWEGKTHYVDSSPTLNLNQFVGYHATTSKVNAVRFRMASGNITSGYITVRRRRPS